MNSNKGLDTGAAACTITVHAAAGGPAMAQAVAQAVAQHLYHGYGATVLCSGPYLPGPPLVQGEGALRGCTIAIHHGAASPVAPALFTYKVELAGPVAQVAYFRTAAGPEAAEQQARERWHGWLAVFHPAPLYPGTLEARRGVYTWGEEGCTMTR